MINTPEAATRSRHSGRAGLVFISVASMLIFLLLIALLGVGRWLVVQDPLEKARAIVVLSGGMPLRAIEAARLYRAGYAPQVWLTQPEEPRASLEALDIPYPGEESYDTRVLVHEGVPSAAIAVLASPINNTADEINVIAAELTRQKSSTVIIVTSKAHTRRVRQLWHKVVGTQGRAVVRASTADPFDPARWWRTSSDALDVVREVLGLLNTWAGLPLHPAT